MDACDTKHEGPGPVPKSDWRVFALAAIVAVLVVVIFRPCLNADFVNWDDDKNLVDNPHFGGLWPGNLWWMFTTTHMGPYQPLSWVTLAIDYSLWGMNPRGYHLTNVVLHAFNAGLLCLVTLSILDAARRLRPGPLSADELHSVSLVDSAPAGTRAASAPSAGMLLASALAALAWAVHPQHVESVAWVTERRDVLSGLFYLLSVWYYLQGHRTGTDGPRHGRWERISLACCALALLSKATAVSLPVVLIVLDVYPLRRLTGNIRDWWRPPYRHVITEKFNYMLFSVMAIVVGFVGQSHTRALQSLNQVGVLERVAIGFHSAGFYVFKTLWPVNLSPLYPRPTHIALTDRQFLLPLIAVCATSLILVLVRRRLPGALAAWTCYLVALSPVCGVITIGDELVADRYSYLPTLGLFVLAGGIVTTLCNRGPGGTARRLRQVACLSVAVVLVVLCAGRARRLMSVWHDSLSLWTYVTRERPDAYKAWNNLAGALTKAKQFIDAEAACRKALAIKPDYATGYYNLGVALTHLSRYEEARRTLMEAIRLEPDNARACGTLGSLLDLWMNQPAQAVVYLEKAVKLDPNGTVRMLYLLGDAYRQLGQYEAAARSFRSSMQAVPTAGNLRMNLVALTDVYLALNRIDQAEEAARRAVALAAGAPECRYAMAQVRSRQGRITEALEELRPALEKKEWYRDVVRTDPNLRAVREDPRFAQLMDRLPPPARSPGRLPRRPPLNGG
jgi:protein O-mannosyl-transferase